MNLTSPSYLKPGRSRFEIEDFWSSNTTFKQGSRAGTCHGRKGFVIEEVLLSMHGSYNVKKYSPLSRILFDIPVNDYVSVTPSCHSDITPTHFPVVEIDIIEFPIVFFPGWVVMFLDFHRTVFVFRIWFDLLDVVLAVFISILKFFRSLQNCWHNVTDITSFGKHFGRSLGHTRYSELLSIFGVISFQELYQKESLARSSTVV